MVLKTLVILPTYNEADNIEKIIKNIKKHAPNTDILVIDDHSPDKTAELVKKIPYFGKDLFLIERAGKLGLGTAYVTGFKWSLERDYEYTISMDSDFSHDACEISTLLEKAKTHDLVIGSRYVGGIRIINWPMKRLLLSYYASILVKFVLRLPIHDATGGFNCYSKKALKQIALDQVFSIGYVFQIEMKFRIFSNGLSYVEHPITFYERRNGKSKLASSVIFEGLLNLFKLKYLRIINKL